MSSIYLVQLSILIIFTLQLFHSTTSTTGLQSRLHDELLPLKEKNVAVPDVDNTLKHYQIQDSSEQSSSNEEDKEDDGDDEHDIEFLSTNEQNQAQSSTHHHQKHSKRATFRKRIRDGLHGGDSNRLWAIPYRFGKRSAMPYRFGKRAAMHFRLGRKSID
ncbi:unnamed protein product [Didymodactylos carnosus]|uniref:Uncharacterized protein n=1 Tax=Didymodactylos carnosus TaxID=1234261 RepID=A0A813RJM1_9BILA|nr:unnamed protein product [Didymodactylos carnosus]CAF0782267.1 unnamed protein product [Didymodactylos carnosus]CAF3508374.1 unnamed protein product [Didymodactylos carnosus]CAF3565712.1 unnamed protein product [Didymodactylos carnosus]